MQFISMLSNDRSTQAACDATQTISSQGVGGNNGVEKTDLATQLRAVTTGREASAHTIPKTDSNGVEETHTAQSEAEVEAKDAEANASAGASAATKIAIDGNNVSQGGEVGNAAESQKEDSASEGTTQQEKAPAPAEKRPKKNVLMSRGGEHCLKLIRSLIFI